MISPRRYFTGFTLLELMLAIGVIAILIAFLFPMMGRMRESAQRVGCVRNLKTIGGAITAYAIENRGRLPGPSFTIVDLGKAYSIAGKMQAYLDPTGTDSVWECPANPALIALNQRTRLTGGTRRASYVTHAPYFGYTYTPPKPSPDPMLLADVKELPRAQQWLLEDVDYWSYPDVTRVGGNYPPVHRGGRNRLYPDMSVEWYQVISK